MIFWYNTIIKIYTLFISLFAKKNTKARAWAEEQRNLLLRIEKKIDTNVRYTWFHFASLGEFEQGLPVLQQIKHKKPHSNILITFFSPSGYQAYKNNALADFVFYLPIDNEKNAKEFIRLINPELAIFTKYEYWYYYFTELKNNRIPLFVISAIFRSKQPFFKWYGKLHREMLGCVTHFFVQNIESKTLLESLNIYNVTISGDTRFDRVAQNSDSPKLFPEIKEFCNHSNVCIAGSTWPDDESLIVELVKQYPDWKFIVAPHEINNKRISSLEKSLAGNAIRCSDYKLRKLEEQEVKKLEIQVLIIDNIGMLSSLYQYGNIAYIGGGFGVGIHNILEAAAFGLPIIFGPNYQKFQEAKDLIDRGGAKSINNLMELQQAFGFLTSHPETGEVCKQYVKQKIGATEKILKIILKN